MCWVQFVYKLTVKDCDIVWKIHTYTEQDRQCTYYVTSRRVRATIIAVKVQSVLHNMSGICSLWYSARNAHASSPLYNIFPHFLLNGKIFEKTLLNTKCVFWFPLQLLSETFLILRRNARDMIKMYTGLHVKYLLFLSSFNGTWIFSADFRKMLKY